MHNPYRLALLLALAEAKASGALHYAAAIVAELRRDVGMDLTQPARLPART